MNWIIVGGAPLSRETHEFIRVCLGSIVVQVQLKNLFELFSLFNSFPNNELEMIKLPCIIYFYHLQGYSLTESTCTGTVMENIDLGTDSAGKPMAGVEARLVDWEEGEYRITDKPNPRGEIVLGGEPIAKVTKLQLYFYPNYCK